ncbi:unnamed protein product, partial [marine sediment metagenome]
MMTIMLYVMPWLLFVLLVITWVPWRGIFEKLWGNNPLRGKIYVEAGEQITICKGKYYTDTPKGLIYQYKYFKMGQSVIVPFDYPYRYILGCRQIRVMAGQGAAAPLGGMSDKQCVVSGGTLNAVLEAHIGTELARTIFGKTMNIMMIVIIAAGIMFVGYFLFKQFMTPTPGAIQPPAQEQQLTPEQQKA